MKNYELLAVLKPSLDSEELDKVVDKISEEIKSYQGSVASVDKMGRKKLAYDVQGYRDGFFTTMIVSLPAESIVEFKKNLKLKVMSQVTKKKNKKIVKIKKKMMYF